MGLGTFSGGGLGFGVAFSLYDEFSQTAGRIESGMAQLGIATDQMTNRINTSLNQMAIGAGMVALGAALISPFVIGIQNASDYAENLNKLDVAFGSYAAKVREFTDSAGDNFGIDKIQASNMAALFGDMGTGMGLAQQQAADMSMSLVSLAGDISSFKNISHDMASTALKSIFTGETESLKNLGIVMTEANLKVFAATQGITKSMKDMTQVEKTMLRYQYVMAMSKNSLGDFARTSEGYANSQRAYTSAMTDLSVTLGDILMPLGARLFQLFTKLSKALRGFLETPIGQGILKAVAVLAGLLIVVGSLIVVVNLARISVYKLSGAFGDATKSMILQAIAEKGVAAGFRVMAVAAWQALAPMLIMVAQMALVVGFFYVANRLLNEHTYGLRNVGYAMLMLATIINPLWGGLVSMILVVNQGLKDFDGYLSGSTKRLSGFAGFFQKVGGVIRGVGEMLSTWDTKTGTFTWTKELDAALTGLGIKDFVLSIGTWIARLGAFWEGLKEGFVAAVGLIKDTIMAVINFFMPVEKKFNSWNDLIGKNTSLLSSWKKYGVAAGIALVSILTVLAGSFIATGIAAVIASWPLLLIVAGILAIGAAGMYIYNNWNKWMSALGFDMILVRVQNFVEFVQNIPSALYQFGANMIKGMWDGIKSVWFNMINWLKTELNNSFIGKVMEFTGIGKFNTESAGEAQPARAQAPNRITPALNSIARNRAALAPTFPSPTDRPSEHSNNPIIIQNIMDGEVISERAIDITNRRRERTN